MFHEMACCRFGTKPLLESGLTKLSGSVHVQHNDLIKNNHMHLFVSVYMASIHWSVLHQKAIMSLVTLITIGHRSLTPIQMPNILLLVFEQDQMHVNNGNNMSMNGHIMIIMMITIIIIPLWCSQIAKFMGPAWGPFGSCRPQMGPMLARWSSPCYHQSLLYPYYINCKCTQSCIMKHIHSLLDKRLFSEILKCRCEP